MKRLRAILGALVVTLAACSKSSDVGALQREATAITVFTQPRLDALVVRIRVLKRDLRGNMAGWETMLRTAELANDELGLPPFTQSVPAGPSWKPSPATLLGIGSYVHGQADELANHGKRRELERLVVDERRRYEEGIGEVDRNLSQVESWLALARDKHDP